MLSKIKDHNMMEVTKKVDQWIASKEPDLLSRNPLEKWENVVLLNGKYFELNIFYFTISISALLFIKKTARTKLYTQ